MSVHRPIRLIPLELPYLENKSTNVRVITLPTLYPQYSFNIQVLKCLYSCISVPKPLSYNPDQVILPR